MIPLREASRAAVRLVRSTPTRSAVVVAAMAAPIGYATVSGVSRWESWEDMTWAAGVVAIAVLTVGQASPEPQRAAGAHAWIQAGASQRRSRLPGRMAGLALAWAALLVGVAIGLVAAALLGHPPVWGDVGTAALTGAAILAVVVAMVRPAGRERPRPAPSRVRTVLLWVLAMPLAVFVASTAARGITSDFNAAISIPLVAALTTFVIVVAMRPLLVLALRLAELVPPLRAAAVVATGHPASRLVRAVVVVAMLSASTGTILGVSAAQRGNPYEQLDREVAALPVVPPTVAVLEVSTVPAEPSPSTTEPALSTEDRERLQAATVQAVAEVRSQLPDATIITTTRVVDHPLSLFLECALGNALSMPCDVTALVGDPRLDSVPGLVPADPSDSGIFSGNGGSLGGVVSDWEQGTPLPAATWRDMRVVLVPAEDVELLDRTTAPGPIFITRSEPFTAEERARLETLGVQGASSGEATVQVTTSDDLTGPTSLGRPGAVPFAATDRASRWRLVVIAAALALLTAIATVTIAAHDRKAGNQRLERLGASPRQIRGAVTLHTGLLVGLAAFLAGLASALLIGSGLDDFNARLPGLAIPFTLPAAPMFVLVVVVPLVAAALAATVARPPGRGAHG